MFGLDSKKKLKEIWVFVADQEIQIEKLRQQLCAMREFEPYSAFRRIDRGGTGLIDKRAIC